MEKILTQLIEEEIRLTAFIRSLYRLEVDATHYLPNLCNVIFELSKVERTDERSDQYFQMIEKGIDAKDRTERMLIAHDVLAYLNNLN